MFEQRPALIAIRGFTVAVCMALLASCAGTNISVADKSLPAALTAPAVPIGLAATAGNDVVSLAWTASDDATGYNVKRATSSGGPYMQLAAPTSPVYMDSSVADGTTYYYVVSAVDAAGESSNSTEASATPEAPSVAPAAPIHLSATAGNAQASLTWSPSSGAASYNVKRSTTSGGPYTQVAAVMSPSYTDPSVSNGTTYYYVVTADNSVGESANSAQASVTPDATVATPPVPTGLVATAGNAEVTLAWSASGNATSYHVKRATTNGGPYSQVGAPTSTSYTDPSLRNGTTYYYVVSAVDSTGESANSAQVSAIPVVPTVTTPTAPTGLAATAGNAQVSLTWSVSSGAASYHVKRATTSGGPYTQVGAPASPAYTDTSVTAGTTYYYVVSALNSAGESVNSAQVSATPVAAVPPPTTFGTWINVTPSNANLTSTLSCGNYGTESVQADTANPGNMYTEFNCQGIWKSTDYGQTWTGPINTGTNAAKVSDCAGGITISPSRTTGGVPTLYQSCIRGTGMGFWKSVDGGVNWVNYPLVPPLPSTQDVYPPTVDPYNPNHLLMAAHEQDYLLQSNDGGHTWATVTLNSGMLGDPVNTAAIFFINTGNASTTANTWLWIAQISGGLYGTWRTSNGGTVWKKVDKQRT